MAFRALRSCCLALALAAFPGIAAAAEPKPERPREAAAEEALEAARDAFQGRGVRTGRELTHELIELARGLPRLDPAERRAARRLLARPTQGIADPAGGGWSAPPGDQFSHCSANFCVHWVDSTGDAPSLTDSDTDGVPDYVEDMSADFELQHQVQNGTGPGQLGWVEPKSDGALGGQSGKTDVYISDLTPDGLYGYATTDPQALGNSLYGYLVMDDDYVGYGAVPEDARRVTAAHEYNHVLQFTYDAIQDTWMLESSAVWAEEKVYDSIDDYLNYMPTWAGCSEIPLTSPPGGGSCSTKVYGSGVWNLWLDDRYGAEVVRSAWSSSLATSPASYAPGAYDSAVRASGGPGFSAEFGAFAAAAAEWRAPGSGIPEGSSFGADVERVGVLADGGSAIQTLDHSTFALLDVPVPAGSPAQLRLNAALPTGAVGALALVGRTGGSPTAGTLATEIQQLPSGGQGSVVLANPGNYSRITAVLVNSSAAQAGWDSAAQDWKWTMDDVPMSTALSSTGNPTPPDVEFPDTTITRAPESGRLAPAEVEYEFSSSKPGASFECSFDGGTYRACGSPQAYSGLDHGVHTFAVRARDAHGQLDRTPAQHSFAVSPAVPGSGPDVTRPTISQIGLAPTRFRAARSGASIAGSPVGTRVTYALSETASVAFSLQRLAAGRRAGSRCVKPTRRNRRRRACTRVLALSQGFADEGRAGFNNIRFTGRLGGRPLRPGRYRMALVAQDAAGHVSDRERLSFRIVRR